MAFSFGQSPAPAPGGNAPAPSFTFGSMAANTPAPGTTSFGEAPAPATGASAGPSFGSSTNTTTGNTAAPTATAGFGSTGTTFGSSNNNNDKATPNTSASTGVSFGAPASSGQDNKAPAAPAFGAATGNSGNAPATSGFGFAGGDNKTSNAQAPAPAGGFYGTSSGAPAPSSTNAFGASNPAPAPTGGLSFAGTAGNTTAFGAPNPAPAPATPQGLKVDAFQDIFPNIAIHDKVKYLLEKSASATEEGRERASELIELLRCDSSNETKSIGRTLVAPKALQYTGPDNNVRNQLQTNPQVVLAGDREATLLPEMLREVARIADDLRISEKEALSLYAEVNNPATIPMLEARLEESIIDQTKRMSQDVAAGGFSRVNLGTNAVKAAKELYFFERQRLLRTILVLVQSRIEAPQHPWGPLITRATDNLLQNDLVTKLVQLVRDWSNIIKNIESELARRESAEANSPGEGPEKEKKFYFDQVHLAFALKERQTAAECLYFIAYHTQCTASEVALLIDIVRDLTNSNKDRLILLDPFKDVPSPYEDRPESQQAWAPHFQSSLPPLKERGHLEWERELVKKTWKTTKPQLLNCVSTLVMTIIAALDAKQVLYDRLTHQENSIGMGNALFPPGGSLTDALEPIHKKFAKQAGTQWIRTDIWALLAGSYALLLSSSPTLISSPRHSSTSPGRPHGSAEVRRSFRYCLRCLTELKAITFAKNSLLPVLRRPYQYPGTKCDASEFYLLGLSEFVSKLLDIFSSSSLPPSRKNWQTEQEEGLQLERENQKQRAEFRLWAGQYDQGPKEEAVPSSVNLMKRPDCIDDLIVLAISVADLGPEYALKFWDVSGPDDDQGASKVSLSPSRALNAIQKASSDDDSLIPFYLAFLGALAKAESPELEQSGAGVVNKLLFTAGASNKYDWRQLLEAIRWYVRRFNDTGSSSTSATTSSGPSSTSYYYRTVNLMNNPRQVAQTANTSESTKLGDKGEFYLLSLLNLISNVASKSPESRVQLLSLQLAIKSESSSTFFGNDATLNILFSFGTAPLPPEIRGMTFTAIADLLNNDSLGTEDRTKMLDFSLKAWELVESCQVLPILLLDQYPQVVGEEMLRSKNGIKFPASSTSLAGSGPKSDSWVPVDQQYAILYEMEHVESRKGYYTSTEGFLRLLNSLFVNSCPPTLGGHWRLRCGCTPYIEYVIHYVLPRATGCERSFGKLLFRSKGDQSRLVGLALEVVESVLVRYSYQAQKHPSVTTCPTSKEALEFFRNQYLVDKVVVSNGQKENLGDFDNSPARPVESKDEMEQSTIQTSTATQQMAGASAMSIPAPKSPGFVVLADLLSASEGNIIKAIAFLFGGRVEATSVIGEEASRLADTYALFNETPPTTTSSKHALTGEKNPPPTRARLLKRLRPFADTLSYVDAVYWREKGVGHALQILVASAVREGTFYERVKAATSPLRIVPVLKFGPRSSYVSQVNATVVHLLRLRDLLLASRDLLGSIVEFIGYKGSSDEQDMCIAMCSLSLAFFLHQSLPGRSSTQALCGSSIAGCQRLARAISRRLLVSFDHRDSIPHSDIVSLIFYWILADLRRDGESGLSYGLLGLPNEEAHHGLSRLKMGTRDCFDAILELLSNQEFIVDNKTSGFASSCFEILVRACDFNQVTDVTSMRQVLFYAERLHSIGFWTEKIRVLLQNRGIKEPTILETAVKRGDEQVVHCVAWLLKGVASELHRLMGHCPDDGHRASGGIVGYLAPKYRECQKILSLLFGAQGHLLENVVEYLPLERMHIYDAGFSPSQEVGRRATRTLEGAPEIVTGWEIVDEDTLLSLLPDKDKARADELRLWSDSWNRRVKFDCAASHLSHSLKVLLGEALVGFSLGRDQRVDGLFSLLTSTINQLLHVPISKVSATASLNLSWTILLLSRVVAAVVTGSRTGVADALIVRDLLARAVVASGSTQLVGGPEEVRHQERTAIVSVALVEIMESLSEPVADIDSRIFLDVAVVLAQLSATTEAGQISPSHDAGQVFPNPTEAAILARSCLASLVEIWDEDISNPSESLAYNFLTQQGHGASEACIEPFIRLLASLDEGMVTLLQGFAHVPFVGDLLLNRGLLSALERAADLYRQEEQRLVTLSLQHSTARQMAVGFPGFLKKHLDLLGTLLATSGFLSEKHRRELPTDFIKILSKYEVVVQRLFASFPDDGDSLCTLVQTIAQVMILSDTASNGVSIVSTYALQPIPSDRASIRGTPCETAIVELSLRIAENPLPSNHLPKLPHSLTKTKNTLSSALVDVSTGKENAWWNMVDGAAEKSSPPADFCDWTEAIFERALLGAELLEAGLTLVARMQLQSFPQEVAFVRGLFQLLECAMSIDAQVTTLDRDVLPQFDSMDITVTSDDKSAMSTQNRLYYLKSVGRKHGRNALRLLICIADRVKLFAQEPENQMKWSDMEKEEYGKALFDTINRTELGIMGIGCTTPDDRQLAKELSASLRENCKLLCGEYL